VFSANLRYMLSDASVYLVFGLDAFAGGILQEIATAQRLGTYVT